MRLRPSALLIVCCLAAAPAARTGESRGWQSDLRNQARLEVAQRVRDLDAPPQFRTEQVNFLLHAARGEERGLVLEQLLSALDTGNVQLETAAVEVLARIGDSSVLHVLARHLRYDSDRNVRLTILQILPAFLIDHDLQRNEAVEALLQDPRTVPEHVRALFRREPFRGTEREFLEERHQASELILAAIAEQLDPFRAAISGVGTAQEDPLAQRILTRWVGRPIGRTRRDWSETWERLERLPQALAQNDAEEDMTALKLQACLTLQNLAAPGTDLVVENLERLVQLNHSRSAEMAMRTMAALADLAGADLIRQTRELQTPLPDREREWRERRAARDRSMLTLARRCGELRIESETPALRANACRNLAAGQVPRAVDPTEQGTAARRAAVALLRKRRLAGESDPLVLVALTSALGRIGGTEAAQELASLARQRTYGSTSSDLRHEYRTVRAAVDGLGNLLGSGDGPSAWAAADLLLELLADERPLAGGPVRPTADESAVLRMTDLALHALQMVCRSNAVARDPAHWRPLLQAVLPPRQ